jgi:hypothetical protein
LLFNTGDASMLAEMIGKCRSSPSLTVELGRQARADIKDRTWENTASELCHFVLRGIGAEKK